MTLSVETVVHCAGRDPAQIAVGHAGEREPIEADGPVVGRRKAQCRGAEVLQGCGTGRGLKGGEVGKGDECGRCGRRRTEQCQGSKGNEREIFLQYGSRGGGAWGLGRQARESSSRASACGKLMWPDPCEQDKAWNVASICDRRRCCHLSRRHRAVSQPQTTRARSAAESSAPIRPSERAR